MRTSKQGVQCEDDVDIDWGLILAAEQFATGEDIHDCRALLCMYRDACEMLQSKPRSKYAAAKKIEAEKILRSLIARHRTVQDGYEAKRAWWVREGDALFHEDAQ
jgi:hypothetical protein